MRDRQGFMWFGSVAVAATLLTSSILGTGRAGAAASSIPLPPFHECPAVGNSPSCQILLVVNPDRTVSVYGDPAVGPYDGGDDTLVGIWNQSSSPVDAVTVTGAGSGLSGLDGDGLCTFGVTGCPFGPTGYEGPGITLVTAAQFPDAAEVDFTGGLAGNSTAYFSLEGALSSAQLTARPGHLSGIQLSAAVTDFPPAQDPDTSASVLLTVTVLDAGGNPAVGATVTKTRGGQTSTFHVGATGVLRLVEKIGGALDPAVTLSAVLGPDSATANVVLYTVGNSTYCKFDGKPEKLNALRNLLDLVELPSSGKPIVDGFLQLFFGGAQFIPARFQTELVGQVFTGPQLTPMYELYLNATDLKTGRVVNTSDLFSRKAHLLDVVTGMGKAPLQAFAQRMNCGTLA